MMSEGFEFAPMVWEGNLSDNWKTYYQGYEIALRANGKLEKADDVRCSILLNKVGKQGMKLYNTFTYAEAGDNLKTAIVA